MNDNIQVTKLLHLCNWVRNRVGLKFNNKVYSNDLYQCYLKETVHEAHLTEKQFFNQIDAVMSTFSLNPVKLNRRGIRSYVGIEINVFKSDPLMKF